MLYSVIRINGVMMIMILIRFISYLDNLCYKIGKKIYDFTLTLTLTVAENLLNLI